MRARRSTSPGARRGFEPISDEIRARSSSPRRAFWRRLDACGRGEDDRPDLTWRAGYKRLVPRPPRAQAGLLPLHGFGRLPSLPDSRRSSPPASRASSSEPATCSGSAPSHTKIKDSAYECGVPGEGVVHTRFSVKFYVTALLFMLFDLEIVILVPWVFIYREFLHQHIPIQQYVTSVCFVQLRIAIARYFAGACGSVFKRTSCALGRMLPAQTRANAMKNRWSSV